MKELEMKDIRGLLRFNQGRVPIYIYTPLCGTCKIATKMLEVVEELVPHLTIYRVNINHLPKLAETWRIESVPCLLFLSRDQVVYRRYAFESVHTLYDTFKKMGIE